MEKKLKIALIEDELDIQELLAKELKKQGYEVITESNGILAEKRLMKEKELNLVILDINLPDKDGISIMQELRKTSMVPILILSAKDTEFDKIIGLEHGADDYLTKPFSVYELLARVKSILRRNTDYLEQQEIKPVETEIRVFDFLLLPDEYAIKKQEGKIQLTNKEFLLLKLFIDNPNKLFTKYQLYKEIWNDEFLNDENVLNVTIRRLRKKIEVDPSNPKYVITVWGIGYKLGETK